MHVMQRPRWKETQNSRVMREGAESSLCVRSTVNKAQVWIGRQTGKALCLDSISSTSNWRLLGREVMFVCLFSFKNLSSWHTKMDRKLLAMTIERPLRDSSLSHTLRGYGSLTSDCSSGDGEKGTGSRHIWNHNNRKLLWGFCEETVRWERENKYLNQFSLLNNLWIAAMSRNGPVLVKYRLFIFGWHFRNSGNPFYAVPDSGFPGHWVLCLPFAFQK